MAEQSPEYHWYNNDRGQEEEMQAHHFCEGSVGGFERIVPGYAAYDVKEQVEKNTHNLRVHLLRVRQVQAARLGSRRFH